MIKESDDLTVLGVGADLFFGSAPVDLLFGGKLAAVHIFLQHQVGHCGPGPVDLSSSGGGGARCTNVGVGRFLRGLLRGPGTPSLHLILHHDCGASRFLGCNNGDEKP